MNKRVLIVSGSYPPMRCGVGDYSYNLAKSLVINPKFQVAVLTSVFAGHADKPTGVEIFPVMRHWGLLEAPKVKEVIRRWSPDIVHIQYPTQGYGKGLLPWLLPMICFLMGKKVVQTWHEGYGRRSAPLLFLKSIVPSVLIFVRPEYKEGLDLWLRWALWKKRTLYIQNASGIPRAEISEQEKERLKKHYLKKQRRLIVFFGFVYPHKGAELLFEIANPALDQIVIAGEISKKSDYRSKIMAFAATAPWIEKVTIAGFLSASDAAALLAVADAVILPFRAGSGRWSTSINAAILNKALVITTSMTQNGYDKKRNVYFAKVDDIQEMKSALAAYGGTRRNQDPDIDRDEWLKIAQEHGLLYKSILS